MTTSAPASVRKLRWIAVLAAVVPVMAQAGGETGERARAGDYLQVGLPVAALALTFLVDDMVPGESTFVPVTGSDLDLGWPRLNGSPRHDLVLALARTEIATYGLKYGIEEQRPNGEGQSFPSGHTSIAFAGAEFIRKQYGWALGTPAYLTAGFVGWSRVESGNHWTHDVLAGAAIGILSNHDDLAFSVPLGRGDFGRLTFAPALLPAAHPIVFDVSDHSFDEVPDDPLAVAPGLRLEFRF